MTNTIKFVPTFAGLTGVDDVVPKPTKEFIPEWWKQLAYVSGENTLSNSYEGNVKSCPSFIDYFLTGYVVPMWSDVILGYNRDTLQWGWKTRDTRISWGGEDPNQVLNVIPYSFMGDVPAFTFKAFSPWRIITPPGYSTLILPLFFHFNSDFSVVPGIVDTDIHHTINPDVMFHSKKTELFIERGTPFFQAIPFKRESFEVDVLEMLDIDEETFKKLATYDAEISTKFIGSRTYQKFRKK
jgi:hypothetical protein